MTPRKPKHGGKRKGAGRPAPAGARTNRVMVNLTDWEYRRCQDRAAIGGILLVDYIRFACLRAIYTPEAALVDPPSIKRSLRERRAARMPVLSLRRKMRVRRANRVRRMARARRYAHAQHVRAARGHWGRKLRRNKYVTDAADQTPPVDAPTTEKAD